MKRKRTKRPWNGMNWIRQEKRLAIMLRDNLACLYCGSSVEESVQLTLDHFIPVSKGGDNHETNLFTACKRCNSARKDRSVLSFCKAVGEYLCEPYQPIYLQICTLKKRKLPLRLAKQHVAARGSAAKYLNGLHLQK